MGKPAARRDAMAMIAGDGIPSPAIIAMASLRAAGCPIFVVDAGSEVSPQTPYFRLGSTPGRSLVTGNAVEDVEGLFERGQHLGHHLAKLADYLVLGESVPAGTTTALAVMLALGMDAEDKVSSSMIGGRTLSSTQQSSRASEQQA